GGWSVGPADQGEARLSPWLFGDQLILVVDLQASIQQLAHVDAGKMIGASSRTGWDLDPTTGDSDGVVTRHRACIAAAEDAVEISRYATPSRTGFARRPGEAVVEVRNEGWQVSLRGLHGGDVM